MSRKKNSLLLQDRLAISVSSLILYYLGVVLSSVRFVFIELENRKKKYCEINTDAVTTTYSIHKSAN